MSTYLVFLSFSKTSLVRPTTLSIGDEEWTRDSEEFLDDMTIIFKNNFWHIFECCIIRRDLKVLHDEVEVRTVLMIQGRRQNPASGQSDFLVLELEVPEHCGDDDVRGLVLRREFLTYFASESKLLIPEYEIRGIGFSKFRLYDRENLTDKMAIYAFFGAGWIFLLRIQRRFSRMCLNEFGNLTERLNVSADMREQIAHIKILFLNEDRAKIAKLKEICDDMREKFKFSQRYEHLNDSNSQLETVADLRYRVKALRIARAISATLHVFSVLSISIALLSFIFGISLAADILVGPEKIISNQDIVIYIFGSVIVSAMLFIAAYAINWLIFKNKI